MGDKTGGIGSGERDRGGRFTVSLSASLERVAYGFVERYPAGIRDGD